MCTRHIVKFRIHAVLAQSNISNGYAHGTRLPFPERNGTKQAGASTMTTEILSSISTNDEEAYLISFTIFGKAFPFHTLDAVLCCGGTHRAHGVCANGEVASHPIYMRTETFEMWHPMAYDQLAGILRATVSIPHHIQSARTAETGYA